MLPFGVKDRSKSGHIKVLMIALVDPNIKIISTAYVPPQQQSWYVDGNDVSLQASGCSLSKDPGAPADDLCQNPFLTIEEAEAFRARLHYESSQTIKLLTN